MLARINWQPTPRELRLFGAVILIAFGAIGWWQASRIIFWSGVAVGAMGLTGTRLALPFYQAWMGLAFVIGSVMSRVMLAVVFFGVVTPVGLLARMAGRDRLALTKKPAATYWRELPDAGDSASYQRQF